MEFGSGLVCLNLRRGYEPPRSVRVRHEGLEDEDHSKHNYDKVRLRDRKR